MLLSQADNGEKSSPIIILNWITNSHRGCMTAVDSLFCIVYNICGHVFTDKDICILAFEWWFRAKYPKLQRHKNIVPKWNQVFWDCILLLMLKILCLAITNMFFWFWPKTRPIFVCRHDLCFLFTTLEAGGLNPKALLFCTAFLIKPHGEKIKTRFLSYGL